MLDLKELELERIKYMLKCYFRVRNQKVSYFPYPKNLIFLEFCPNFRDSETNLLHRIQRPEQPHEQARV